MELWTIVVTAGIGLFAGQIGAWLQSRRDATAEQGRQAVETARLREQLRDSREQRDRDREQVDALEWRERRLAIYEAASSAARALLNSAHRVANNYFPKMIELAADASKDSARALDEALDKIDVVGTKANRDAALRLSIAAGELTDAIRFFDSLCAATTVVPTYDDDRIAEGIEEFRTRRRLRRGDEPQTEPSAIMADLESKWEAVCIAIDEFEITSMAWQDVARAELGVPDRRLSSLDVGKRRRVLHALDRQ